MSSLDSGVPQPQEIDIGVAFDEFWRIYVTEGRRGLLDDAGDPDVRALRLCQFALFTREIDSKEVRTTVQEGILSEARQINRAIDNGAIKKTGKDEHDKSDIKIPSRIIDEVAEYFEAELARATTYAAQGTGTDDSAAKSSAITGEPIPSIVVTKSSVDNEMDMGLRDAHGQPILPNGKPRQCEWQAVDSATLNVVECTPSSRVTVLANLPRERLASNVGCLPSATFASFYDLLTSNKSDSDWYIMAVEILGRHATPNFDEGVADMSDNESTTSVGSWVENGPIEHGRRYHAYKPGLYYRPNDQRELNRLDFMHKMFMLVNNGELHRAPFGPGEQRILDIGSGTGAWCFAMGDKYPGAEIQGVDISDSAPSFVPLNVRFEIHDVEDPWTYSRPFDYIHSRDLAGSIEDWEKLIRQCHQHLSPGGWVEFVDIDYSWFTDDGSPTPAPALTRYATTVCTTETRTYRTFCSGHRLEEWIQAAGFVNIHAVKSPLPLGCWSSNPRLKKIGAYNQTQIKEDLQGSSPKLFIDILGWQREELDELLRECKRELGDPNIHVMTNLYTVWAQKSNDQTTGLAT